MVPCSGHTYLVPLANSVSSTVLEKLLVVRNAIFAVDEAVAGVLLAIIFAGRNEAIPLLASSFPIGTQALGAAGEII